MKSTFVLFGATGDLAKAKILPALKVIGVEPLLYVRRDIDAPDYIKGNLDQIHEKLNGSGVTHAYVSLPPMYFEAVLRGLALLPTVPRIALEKPFGISYADAQKLTSVIKELGLEKHIYLVDHYLGKPALVELLHLSDEERKRDFNKDRISHIVIDAFETNNVATRGAFYDSVGTIRDFIQNHVLAIISTILLQEKCTKASTECRQEVLKHIAFKNGSLTLGQYVGFKESIGVRANSQTETFASLRLVYADAVNIGVRVGKAMNESKTEARVVYKDGTEKIIAIQSPVNSYERILKDFISNGTDYPLSYEEALMCWEITEDILEEKEGKKLVIYPQGAGPDQIA